MITSEFSNRSYSTRLRTALVLTGTGTAGAYHAGVLRALHEAGVRVDVIAGRGVGAVGAVFGAVDGAQRLWDEHGLWKGAAATRAYRWRRPLQIAGWTAVVAVALLCVPLVLFGLGIVAAMVGFLLGMVGSTRLSGSFTTVYGRWIDWLFSPPVLPTVLPRLVLACVVILVATLAAGVVVSWLRAPARRRIRRGALGWLLGAPLSAAGLMDLCANDLWKLIRGAAPVAAPAAATLGRHYLELLIENLGQPGFRELLLIAHDMDARRDVVFAALAGTYRQRFFSRPDATGRLQAEIFDLAGVGREHAIDALTASLRVPVATEPHLVTFAAEGVWRGETHRLCDRPGAILRLLDELAAAGVEQVIVPSAAPPPAGPHELSSGRGDLRGRAGELLATTETAALRDLSEQFGARFAAVHVIRPAHNPLGPLDFDGVYDEHSDRRYTLAELVDRGYEDAYRQFIEPVVAGSSESVASRQ
ncbi:MAG TPA: patatin-like phospholipase family protein [Vicinamibacterales bacterium]|nr:patatin-like phospholipase family protein [Vicinamibacterales bacterium]